MFTEVSPENPKENGQTEECLPKESSSNENTKDKSQSTKEEPINENLFNDLRTEKEINSKESKIEEEIRESFQLLEVFPWYDASISYSKISPSKLQFTFAILSKIINFDKFDFRLLTR